MKVKWKKTAMASKMVQQNIIIFLTFLFISKLTIIISASADCFPSFSNICIPNDYDVSIPNPNSTFPMVVNVSIYVKVKTISIVI